MKKWQDWYWHHKDSEIDRKRTAAVVGVSVVGEPVGDSEGPVVGLLVGLCVGTRLGCFNVYAFIKRKTSQKSNEIFWTQKMRKILTDSVG